MNDTPSHSALREWRAHMATPVRAASLAGVTIVLAVMGPFETSEVMRLAPRLIYWGIIVFGCYSVGYGCNMWVNSRAKGKGLVARALVAAPLTSVGVLAVIYLLNGVALDVWARGVSFLFLAGNVVLISSIITVVFYVAEHSRQPEHPRPDAVALLERLPFDKRAPLVALSVEDHYVRVRTTKGDEMVLMRLADAIKETLGAAGLQVHRSHWIALGQVTAAARKGDGAVLTMSHGPDIPVSRANVPAIKEAGLLPR